MQFCLSAGNVYEEKALGTNCHQNRNLSYLTLIGQSATRSCRSLPLTIHRHRIGSFFIKLSFIAAPMSDKIKELWAVCGLYVY